MRILLSIIALLALSSLGMAQAVSEGSMAVKSLSVTENLGLGTNNPASRVHVKDSSSTSILIDVPTGSSTARIATRAGSTFKYFGSDTSGAWGIWAGNGATRLLTLEEDGDFVVSGAITANGGRVMPGGDTNVFSGQTNSVTLNNNYQILIATGNTAITNITGSLIWASVRITNSTGSYVTNYITIPNARAIGSGTTNIMAIPSGKVGWASFNGAWNDVSYTTGVQQ